MDVLTWIDYCLMLNPIYCGSTFFNVYLSWPYIGFQVHSLGNSHHPLAKQSDSWDPLTLQAS